MLGEKIEKYGADVYLVNTGWTGGKYGVGKRMSLKATRAMVTAALNGSLAKVEYKKSRISVLIFLFAAKASILPYSIRKILGRTKRLRIDGKKACFALCGEFHDKVSRYARKHSKSRT